MTAERLSDKFVLDFKFYQKILILALPVILQQLLRISVDAVDGMILTRVHQNQMTAISICTIIFFVFYTMCCGFSYGSSAIIAQYYGKGDKETIKKVVSTGLASVFFFSLFVAFAVHINPWFFLGLYCKDKVIVDIGAAYLKIVTLMYVPCALSTVMFACCRGVENFKICFFVNVVSYPLNVILDYIFITGTPFTPSLGITGAAIGTAIARFVEFFIIAFYLFKKEKAIELSRSDIFKVDIRILKSFLIVAIPMAIHEFIWSIGTSASSSITGNMEKNILSGFSISYMLYQIIACFMNAIMVSSNVIMGHEIGKASSLKRIKSITNSLLMVGIVGGIISSLFTVVSSELFIGFYNVSDIVKVYARQFMLIFIIIWPFSGLEMTSMISILRAGGDGKTGVITDIISMWLITIPLAYYGAFRLNWAPVVIVAILKFNIVIEALVGFFRALSMKWMKNLTV